MATKMGDYCIGQLNDTDWQGNSYYPGVCGLKNMGNTCYMNSALQCLSNIKILTEFGENNKKLFEWCATDKDHRYLISLYFELIEKMWHGQSECIQPIDFRFKIRQLFPKFNNCQQNDCIEFLTTILNTFHEELKEIEGQVVDDFTDYKTFERCDEYLKNNNTFIANNMHGFQKFSLSCGECAKIFTESYQPFYVISLPEMEDHNRTHITVTLIREDSTVFQIELNFIETAILVKDLLERLFYEFFDKTDQVLICDKLIVTQIYEHSVQKILEPEDSLNGLNGSIYIYECDQSVKWHIFVNLRDDYSYGYPILLDLNDCSYDKIFSKFLQCFQKRLNLLMKVGSALHYIKFTGFNGNHSFVLGQYDHLTEFTQNQKQILNTSKMFGFLRRKYITPVPHYLNTNKDHFPDNMSKTTIVKFEDRLQKYLASKSMDELNKIICNNCNKECKAIEKFDVINGPNILMFQMKANPQNYDMRDNYQCIYPLIFDLSPYLTNDNKIEGEFTYELTAVSNFKQFGPSLGHYTTFAQNYKNHKWYEFNDEFVHQIRDENKLISKDAYLLIYSKIGLN